MTRNLLWAERDRAGNPERPDARKYRDNRSDDQPPIVSAPDLEVSPGYLPQRQILELLIGDDPLERSVSARPLQAEFAHQPLHRTASNTRAFTIELGPNLVDAIHREIL